MENTLGTTDKQERNYSTHCKTEQQENNLVEAEEDEQRDVDERGVPPFVEREAAVRIGVELNDHIFENLRANKA